MRALTKEQMLLMLKHYAEGNRAEDIARMEFLSIHAVNNRLKRIKSVMNCGTTTQAVTKAIAAGDLAVSNSRNGGVVVRVKGVDFE